MSSKGESKSVLRDRLQEPPFRNWVASVLMLDVAKDELQKFTKTEMAAFYKDICTKKTEFLRRRKITDNHRYFQTTNNMTSIQDAWSVAKFYMPEGYKEVTSAEKTDFGGLVHLIINNLRFKYKIDWYNNNEKKSVFEQAREVRNRTMHACPLEIDDEQFRKNKNTLVTMLKGLRNTTVDDAIEKIEKLEYRVLTEKDAVYAFKESLDALEKFKQELITDIPKINTDLENIGTKETASIQNTAHNPQEVEHEHKAFEKTTQALSQMAKKGEMAILNTQQNGKRLLKMAFVDEKMEPNFQKEGEAQAYMGSLDHETVTYGTPAIERSANKRMRMEETPQSVC